ncbi:NUDIX hydrolase [Nocardia veterana]|uniref:NUDIX domain-containing protein n=1 Tax=Nocardia veterana TaxID=132249 RepID=A0A7X6RLG5_9NOCA|nr:NUDIX domain-containing protein [Nocardia veterana]NKY89738.1 NUDIX domain-containing protein [Nocardia veterana]
MATTAEGSNIIIHNSQDQILLFLRDEKPEIPCPGMWALLGGYREPGESPQQCVIREIKEEIGVVLDPETVTHHCTRERHWGLLEHTFKTRLDLDINTITLTEGQRLGWFSEADIASTTLGFEENEMLAEYFEQNRRQ